MMGPAVLIRGYDMSIADRIDRNLFPNLHSVLLEIDTFVENFTPIHQNADELIERVISALGQSGSRPRPHG